MAVKLYGDDLDVLAAKGKEIEAHLEPHSRQRRRQRPSRSPASRCCKSSSIKQQLARYGVPAKVVTDVVESIGSKPLGEVVEGQLRFPLVVRLAGSDARRRRAASARF